MMFVGNVVRFRQILTPGAGAQDLRISDKADLSHSSPEQPNQETRRALSEHGLAPSMG
jgi:hypothetical protein